MTYDDAQDPRPDTIRWVDVEGDEHRVDPYEPAYCVAFVFYATEYWSARDRAWRSIDPEDAALLSEDASSRTCVQGAASTQDKRLLGEG